MSSSYPHATLHPDQTIDAPILANQGLGGVTVALPTSMAETLPAGRYFLARCGAQSPAERATDWQIYARRPLFVADVKRLDAQQSAWTLLPIGSMHDRGVSWLTRRDPGETINLIGPLGHGFSPPGPSANILLVCARQRLPLFQTLIDATLDHGGRLTALVYDEAGIELDAARARLPLAVELRHATDEAALLRELAATLAWADHACVAAPQLSWTQLAQAIRNARFRVEEGFCHLLVEADLVCGVGACLACVVPTARGGLTRACVHGPVLDLVKLAG